MFFVSENQTPSNPAVAAARARADWKAEITKAGHPPQCSYGGRGSGNCKTEGAAACGSFLPSPSSYSLRPYFRTPLVVAFRSPVSAFQRFGFLLRGQSSNVRRVCCWREAILIRRRKRGHRRLALLHLWSGQPMV